MKHDGPEFTPEQVEQQIDLLARSPKTWVDPSSDARLVSELYQVYSDDVSIASSAWQRLAQQVQAAGPQPEAGNATFQARPPMDVRTSWQKGPHVMQFQTPTQFQAPPKRSPRRSRRFLGLCAALLVIAVLVAGMVVVLNDVHQQPGPASPASTATKMPTHVVDEGKVVYHSGNVLPPIHIAWSPDGRRIAVTASKTMSGPWQLKSWDALTGQHVVTYAITNLPLYGVEPLTSVAWSPDGHSLAVASFTGKVDIFDARSGKFMRALTPPLTLNSGSTLPLAMSGSTTESPLSSRFPQSGGGAGSSPAIAWSPDGTYLAESITGKIVIWNARTGVLVKRMTGYYPGGLGVFWAPRGNLLAILGTPGPNSITAASIWDTTTWTLVRQYPDVFTLDWSPDGKQLALVGLNRQSVRIVEATTGQTVKASLNTQFSEILAVHWSPDGSRIVEENLEDKVTIWSVPDGTLLYTFPQDAVNVTWSPDGKYIACMRYAKSGTNSYTSAEIAIWVA
jgi:WD40 repeat protein